MNKLGSKILIMVSTILVFAMATLIVSNVLIFNSIFAGLQEDAKNIVSGSVVSIDAEKLEKVIETESMDIKEYKELQQSMIEYKNDKDAKYFYTLIIGEDNKAYMAIDSSLVDTSLFGEEFDLEDAMLEAHNGKATFEKDPVTDDYGTFISAYAPIKNSAGKIIAIAGIDKDIKSFIDIKNNLLRTTIIVSVVLLILSLIISLLFSKGITKNVKNLIHGLNKISEGDLTEPIVIKSRDEIQTIAETIDNVRKNIAKTLGIIKESSTTVAGRIDNLSAISQELAASSEEVSATINEVAIGTNSQADEMTKINNIINSLGNRIDEAVLANETVNSKIKIIDSNAKTSNNDLILLEEAIKEINISFKEVKTEINDLITYLNKINEITNLIDSIAQQTNILALNAAIEAARAGDARAGDAGKSFAVVADEVKNLASQSKNSAQDITNLLENVMGKSKNVSKTSDNMDSKLNVQIEVINNSIISFKDIVDKIDEAMPKVIEVNNNMKKIEDEKQNILESIEATAAASEEVSASSIQISQTANQLSVSSQEVASSSQDLNELSVKMINSINHFKLA